MSNILYFSPPVGPLNRNTKDDFGTIFQHRLIYHIACRDVLSNQNLLGSTCNINNNLQREETLLHRGGAERENQEKVIREQRELQAGIPWKNEGAERTRPVEHDERLCPGVSRRFILNLFL